MPARSEVGLQGANRSLPFGCGSWSGPQFSEVGPHLCSTERLSVCLCLGRRSRWRFILVESVSEFTNVGDPHSHGKDRSPPPAALISSMSLAWGSCLGGRFTRTGWGQVPRGLRWDRVVPP